MVQKSLKKDAKKTVKVQAANRHGRGSTTKKGKFQVVAKSKSAISDAKLKTAITRQINENLIGETAAKAVQSGSTLKTVRAPILPKPEKGGKKRKQSSLPAHKTQ
ncbi:hypothetical protein CYMTET_33274 [Cymbomonas tetramitiformis]|uniref:Uncharacterized protein n=1 Tax=Cymbomonas tetramitiformis TaxID=36881 RepID=A0AAE0FDC1_9CHLO|nr:hypothetical protein CYMTET_33274 [Cymbomonas tetramitiformis]